MSLDVLSFGETMLRLSPPEGVRLDSATTLSVHAAGTESNTLCALARLGLHTAWLSALSEQTRTVATRLFQRALAQHISVSFDVNYRAKLWSPTEAAQGLEEYCRQASILICTREDAADLWHITGSPREILTQLTNRFANNQRERTFVVTLGHEGAAEMRNGQFASAPVLPTEGRFRFGSGDAFAAGYLYSYLDGPLYRELHANSDISPLLFGNALAALKRCIAGDIDSISPQDVRTLLHNQSTRRFR